MTDLGIPIDIATALTVIVTGVVVPAATAILTSPRTPRLVRLWLPIGLAAIGAVVVVLIRGDLASLPGSLAAWVVLAATIIGLAQTIYALMPATWKTLAAATSPSEGHGRRADRDGVMDGRDTPEEVPDGDSDRLA